MIIVLTLAVILLAILHARTVRTLRKAERDVTTIQIRLENHEHADIKRARQVGDWFNVLAEDIEKALEADKKLKRRVEDVETLLMAPAAPEPAAPAEKTVRQIFNCLPSRIVYRVGYAYNNAYWRTERGVTDKPFDDLFVSELRRDLLEKPRVFLELPGVGRKSIKDALEVLNGKVTA
jgi:hypothetical protein